MELLITFCTISLSCYEMFHNRANELIWISPDYLLSLISRKTIRDVSRITVDKLFLLSHRDREKERMRERERERQ